jgi:hypothetical protein
MRVRPAGFLMVCAAIHASARRSCEDLLDLGIRDE